MDSATSPRARPRSRGFSFKSDRSNGSRSKAEHLTESPDEKQRRDSIWKNSSKANPNAAITEAQPGDAQLLEQATLGSLRSGQHVDANGNVITDPDLSNPTRPRLERPLDTIRSFEKAIDNGYKRRNSMMRSESHDQNQQYQSRRNSSFGAGYESNRYSQGGAGMGGGYYGNRRPDSYAEGPRGNRYNSRGNGYNGNGIYNQQHGHHQSYDTVNSGQTYGSDSTGPWANGTDPSSENSSLDRINATSKPQPDGMYGGQNGYGGYPRPIPEDGAYTPQQQNGYGGGPVQPPGGQRRPIPLGGSGEPGLSAAAAAPPRGSLPSTARPEPEKKKGWLSRRFSKKD